MIVRYQLGSADVVGSAILAVFLVLFLLAASALLRRPGVAGPGLVGGAFVALIWLTLLLLPMVTATVGWGGAAAAGAMAARVRSATTTFPLQFATPVPTGETSVVPTTRPQQGKPEVSVREGRRTARLLLLSAVVVAALILAVTSWLPG